MIYEALVQCVAQAARLARQGQTAAGPVPPPPLPPHPTFGRTGPSILYTPPPPGPPLHSILIK